MLRVPKSVGGRLKEPPNHVNSWAAGEVVGEVEEVAGAVVASAMGVGDVVASAMGETAHHRSP